MSVLFGGFVSGVGASMGDPFKRSWNDHIISVRTGLYLVLSSFRTDMYRNWNDSSSIDPHF